ncbi:MAG: periplasmic heavy metal sensor [Rhodobacteraceae bacterium]|nr:periplasmic heavy metal sensor [Paracoccaceae bacterium]
MSAEQKPRTTRWVRLLLIVSLTANLAVAGLVAGAAWRFHGTDKGRPPPSVGAMLFRELPREERRSLRTELWSENGNAKGGFRERRLADGQAVTAALRAVPFDPAALRSVLDGQAQSREAYQARIQAAWITRVEDMSDAERAQYADRLEKRMLHGHGKHKSKKHD